MGSWCHKSYGFSILFFRANAKWTTQEVICDWEKADNPKGSQWGLVLYCHISLLLALAHCGSASSR